MTGTIYKFRQRVKPDLQELAGSFMVQRNLNARVRLLRTADELFKTYGYYRTGLASLLASAGVSRSNFYYHFPSKQALLEEVLALWLEEIRRELLAPLEDKSLPTSVRIQAMFQACARRIERFGFEVGCPVMKLGIELANPGSFKLSELDRFSADMLEALTRCLREGIRRREFQRDFSAEDAALLISATVHGSILAAEKMKDSHVIIQCGEQLLRLLRPASTHRQP